MKKTAMRVKSWAALVLTAGMLSTGVFAFALPAAATEPAPDLVMANSALVDQPQLEVNGTIVVATFDELDGSSRTIFSVQTEAGESIEILGDFPAGVVTGTVFSGTVALPESVLAANPATKESVEAADGDLLTMNSSAGRDAIAVLDAGNTPLETVEAEFTLPVMSAGTPLAHTVEVAVVNGVTFTDAEVSALVSGLNSFWSGQSNGIVSSVSQTGVTKRFTTATADNCTNFSGVWENAANQFGHTSSYYTDGGGQHLIVVTGADCGAGIGTVGSSVGAGGLIWANVDSNTDLHTIAHEFGHNIGLGHSDVHACNAATRVEGTVAQGCNDYEYYDFVDVMGGGITGSPNTNKLSALNIVHSVELGFMEAGDVDTVTTSETVFLNPISDASGVRGILIPTPSGDPYYLEYRSGTGMDSSNLYTDVNGSIDGIGFGLGVRVMKQRDYEPGYPATSGNSVALLQERAAGDSFRRVVLKEGASFATEEGVIITIDDLTPTLATVSIHVMAVQQTYGSDRYATAVALSQQGYPSGADTVYIAQGADYPDALGAAPAAASQGAPLLLTQATILPASVTAEINRLDPTNIVVVGGTGVISSAVFSQLQDLVDDPNDVIRLAGANRYATARAVVRYAYIDGFTPLPSIAYIATGANYPDALSAAAAGGAIGAPVILVNGAANTLDADTLQLLDDLGVSETRIAGGTGSVSNGIQSVLQGLTTVSRYAGSDRFETSQLLNAAAFPSGTDQVFIATGFQFPDALAGASLAGSVAAPLYVVRTTCVPAQIRADIIGGTPDLVTLVGGPGVLASPVAKLTSC